MSLAALGAAAASACGLPATSLSPLEKGELVNLIKGSKRSYLLARNKICLQWQRHLSNPTTSTRYLSLQSVLAKFPTKHHPFVAEIYLFLDRFGFINFGLIAQDEQRVHLSSTANKVVVLGAGASGLLTARQLQSFGFQVVVVEGRSRIGGRVHTTSFDSPSEPQLKTLQESIESLTQESASTPIDLGASILTGTHGNPVTTIIRQVDHLAQGSCDTTLTFGSIDLLSRWLMKINPSVQPSGQGIDAKRRNYVDHQFQLCDLILNYIRSRGLCPPLLTTPLLHPLSLSLHMYSWPSALVLSPAASRRMERCASKGDSAIESDLFRLVWRTGALAGEDQDHRHCHHLSVLCVLVVVHLGKASSQRDLVAAAHFVAIEIDPRKDESRAGFRSRLAVVAAARPR